MTSLSELTPAARQFRDELRDWLAENAPPGLVGVDVPRRPSGELARQLVCWGGALAQAGLMCVSWPKAYGGRGLSVTEVAVMNDEFRRARVPRLTRGMGESLVGPAIIAHGTDEQKAFLLPRIANGTDRYCQGFSEPGSGSDLASVTTQGRIGKDEIAVTGQKIWTSWYWNATMLFCLCRTGPAAARHRGLSYVLIPIRPGGKDNGVEFRPIRQLTGDSDFAETFLTEARAPVFNIIGGVNNGWRVALTTLASERGGSAITRYTEFEAEFWELVRRARALGRLDCPLVRQELAWAYTKIAILRFRAAEALAAEAHGRPPRNSAAASLHKAMWSEYHRRFGEIALDIIGCGALLTDSGAPGGETAPSGRAGPGGAATAEPPAGRWQQLFLASRAHTIWGGTAEIQRNIIAERGLGLPRSP